MIGNGKADAGVLAHAGEDHGVDADDFAVPVHQRAAGVAGIDGGVGLDGFVDGGAVRLVHRTDRTDDAARHGAGKSEGIADGVNLLSHLQVARVAEHSGREVGRFDLDDGKIVRRVGADDRGAEFLAVVQRDFHLAGVGDHVIVGEDVAFLVDNEARALAFLRHQAVEEVEGDGVRGDVHDRGDVLAVDEDIVLLFGIERLAAGGFGDFDFVGRLTVGQVERPRSPGCEIKECSSQQNCKDNGPQ